MPSQQTEFQFRFNPSEAEAEIVRQQKTLDYDTKEFTVEVLKTKLDNDDIYIPNYQRKFIWSSDRQSKFIESVLLGLPVPFLVCSEMKDGRLEVIDGSQRLRTLKAFLDNQLQLNQLEKLTVLEGYRFRDLPISQQRKFANRTIRMIVLSDRADDTVRFDLFERINSGSVALNPSEFRKGAFPGPFYDLVLECANDSTFKRLCPVGARQAERGEREELVLRFFAYAERYRDFQHDVTTFLNEYIKEQNKTEDHSMKRWQFRRMLEFVERYFPCGFRKTAKSISTPRVRFEAISVGTHLALEADENLVPHRMDWLESDEFKQLTTTHASNSAPRLRARIEYVRDALLAKE
jgi:hypothetical protein